MTSRSKTSRVCAELAEYLMYLMLHLHGLKDKPLHATLAGSSAEAVVPGKAKARA
jgi:hypothetical protein